MSSELKQQAVNVLEEVLRLMGVDATIEADETDERVQLNICGNDTSLLIGKKGQTLDALQYLLNRMVKGPANEERKSVELDADGYRGRREESLIQLARRLGEKALSTGRVVELSPMSPRDRRTVHMTLKETPGLTTRSEGEGEDRRLLIVPEGAAGRRLEEFESVA